MSIPLRTCEQVPVSSVTHAIIAGHLAFVNTIKKVVASSKGKPANKRKSARKMKRSNTSVLGGLEFTHKTDLYNVLNTTLITNVYLTLLSKHDPGGHTLRGGTLYSPNVPVSA